MTTTQRIKKLEARILELESQVRTLTARPSIVVVPAVPLAPAAPPYIPAPQPGITPIPTWSTHPYVGDGPYPPPHPTWCGASPNQTAYSTASTFKN